MKNMKDKAGSKWQRSRTWISPSSTNTSKIHLHEELLSQNIYSMQTGQAQAGRGAVGWTRARAKNKTVFLAEQKS